MSDHIIEITPEVERRVLAERRESSRERLADLERQLAKAHGYIAELEAKIIEQSEAMAEIQYSVEHPGYGQTKAQ